MKATRAGRCLAVALAIASGAPPATARAHAPAAATPATPASEGETAERAAITRAREAARAGDYATALRHYEDALRLQPSGKLHFNIAVCHHRLMMAAPARSPAYEARRAAAVKAYNDYLRADPDAPDAEEVAALVRALGGTPQTENPEPWTIELVEPDAVPDPPSLYDGAATPEPPRTPVDTSTPTGPAEPPPLATTPSAEPTLRGRMGGFIPLVSSNPAQLAGSSELRPLPTLGLGLRGNAFLGHRRRIALGGEAAIATQTASARARHRMSLGWLGVLLEARHPLGRGRFEIGGGGVVGIGWQTLVYSGDDRLRCTSGREASRRGGLWTAARLTLAALLGPRRNHELSLRVGPGLAAFAPGSVPASEDAAGVSCEGEPSAFETFGLREGAALSVTVDIGYAPRF